MKFRPAFLISQSPIFKAGDKKSMLELLKLPNSFIVSLPLYSHVLEQPLDSVPFQKLVIKMKPGLTQSQTDSFIKAVYSKLGPIDSARITVLTSSERPDIQKIDFILNFVFSVAIGLVMFLCIFQLTSSTIGNLLEQKKEIGIMRAMGLSGKDIEKIFIYEGFIVVLSGALLGMAVGYVIGWTLIVQQEIFLNMPIKGYIPIRESVVITGVSLGCAWVSIK